MFHHLIARNASVGESSLLSLAHQERCILGRVSAAHTLALLKDSPYKTCLINTYAHYKAHCRPPLRAHRRRLHPTCIASKSGRQSEKQRRGSCLYIYSLYIYCMTITVGGCTDCWVKGNTLNQTAESVDRVATCMESGKLLNCFKYLTSSRECHSLKFCKTVISPRNLFTEICEHLLHGFTFPSEWAAMTLVILGLM